MRKSGWSKEHRSRLEIDMIRLSSPQEIRWRIYTGPLPNGKMGRGFVADRWACWCIPAVLDDERQGLPEGTFLDRVEENYTLLRIEDERVRISPDPERDEMMALPPEAQPRFGRLVTRAAVDRSGLGVVPAGVPQDSSKSRVENLRSFLNGKSPEVSYPAPGDTWVGNLRLSMDGSLGFYDAGPQPVFETSRRTAQVSSAQVQIKADPVNVMIGEHRMNPMSTALPSTAAIPVPMFIPWFGEVVAATALLAAIGKLTKSNPGLYRHSERFTRHPTETVDYEDLRREIS